MAPGNPLQATVEDYFSDDGHKGAAIDAFTPEPSPGKANVRTKRSNPEDLGTDATPTGRVPPFDGKSDSGYSSQSVAGMSSADSAASATSSQRSPPLHPVPPAAPSPTPAQRPAKPPHHRQQSSHGSHGAHGAPGPPRLSRRDSQASRQPPSDRRPTVSQPPQPKRRDSRYEEDYAKATDSGRLRQVRRQSMLNQPAESAPDVTYRFAQDTRSQVSDPAQYHPPSPKADPRPPRQYHAQGGPVVQPAVSRRLSVNSRAARPTSYHGDPRDAYRPHSNLHQEHGPPPSMSAAFTYSQQHAQHPQHPQHPMAPGYGMAPPYAHPNPYFAQAQQMLPISPPQPYESQRPPLSARGPSMTGHAPRVVPVVTQIAGARDRPIPARYQSYTAAPPQIYPAPQQNRYEDEDASESESESSSEGEYEDPQPRRPVRRLTNMPDAVAPQRRPSMRHANTTPVLDRTQRKPRPQTVVVDRPSRMDHGHERAQRGDRRKSSSRPPLVPSVKSQSEYPSPRGRIIVESPRSDRRQSRQEYNMSFEGRERASRREYNVEKPRQNRSSKVYDTGRDYEREYHDDDEDDEDVAARAPLSNRPRRGTNVDVRSRPQRPVEVKKKVDAAENYISAGRGDRETYADQTFEVARRRTSRVSGGQSEAESSRSKGSDKTNGEIRVLLGNDAPLNLILNGDMEGRTVQLLPGGNGMSELVISGNSRGETAYRSERGSVRRAITSASQAGRDEEDFTERSSQSSHRRRGTRDDQGEPRRLLQSRRQRIDRRAEAEYRR